LGRTRKSYQRRSFDALFPYDKYPDNNSITAVMGSQVAMNKLGARGEEVEHHIQPARLGGAENSQHWW